MTRKVEYLIKRKDSNNTNSDNLTFPSRRQLQEFANVDFFVVESEDGKELVSSTVLRSYLHKAREYKTKSGKKYIIAKYR